MKQTGKAFRFYDYHPPRDDMQTEVIRGLSRPQKHLPPKYFYDERGSRLFDRICNTPEYYPTRSEHEIIETYRNEIAHYIGSGCILIEPGSGNSNKARELLEIITPRAYLPMDISRAWLRKSAQVLSDEYPEVEVHAICADYTENMQIPKTLQGPHRVAFFPGSTIGNFEQIEAVSFLKRIARMTGHHGGLLIGVDIKKDPAILNAAYNDQAGLTAEFNLNILQRINNTLGADFDLNAFRHHAFYNERQGRIEMHLRSEKQQQVTIDDTIFDFEKGECIHTENSYKYTVDEFSRLAGMAGFSLVRAWTDAGNLFSLQYYEIPD